jgi:hypothetical protein
MTYADWAKRAHDVRAALVRLNERQPPDGGLRLLRELGYCSIIDVPEEKYSEVIAAAERREPVSAVTGS